MLLIRDPKWIRSKTYRKCVVFADVVAKVDLLACVNRFSFSRCKAPLINGLDAGETRMSFIRIRRGCVKTP